MQCRRRLSVSRKRIAVRKRPIKIFFLGAHDGVIRQHKGVGVANSVVCTQAGKVRVSSIHSTRDNSKIHIKKKRHKAARALTILVSAR